ncbi:hypothetical protein [Streptomyces antarcticus]|uniref:hypothetical protein n=1 Tax=Streptomyces antarcticus TaxID=2996458 RepID=UPI00226F1168|nr:MULTISPECIES: hypothetical protein [unclassified Streptomyces]MCY0944929.1 hypothetical protein [Streptomyces sp. H34-AA3]MCZ4082101.1 hypothetical protein [Streptomyces sp. H34-S5]
MTAPWEHSVRPDGSPPVNGYGHAVDSTGAMVAVSGQVPVDGDGNAVGQEDDEYREAEKPPACFSVRVAGLVRPDFRAEADALAAAPSAG